jgi:Fe2+ or Zn2+ uptake regulation protein|tara:strand:+ start:161 stop:385 length:225 start_codon:yes stop_codon:yes gene_type:complete
MNKAQNIAFNYIENLINESKQSFTWSELRDTIQESNVTIKNWMTIRAVLQHFKNRGLIVRDEDISTEKYILNTN